MIYLSNIIFALVMGLLMSLSITLVTTFVRIGASENFLFIWLKFWLAAYPVAIVCILIYKPFVSRLTDQILKKINKFRTQ